MSIDACGACMSTIGGVCDKHSKNSINKTMDKKQFIEKCRKEFKEYRKNMIWSKEEGQTVTINLDTAENFLVNKLSDCWDMARDQAIDIHKDLDSLLNKMEIINDSLTSKQEEEKKK